MKFLKMPMRKNSTLIYVVNRIAAEIESDHSTRIDEFINNLLDEMPDDSKSPSDKIIGNILNFSRSYDAKKTKTVGYVEMNLN
ncbi:MAG: hypothetical protein AB7S72_16760 [Draconibacterium sp.]